MLQYGVAINAADPNDPDYDVDLLVASIVDRGLHLQYAAGHTGHVDVTVQATDQAGLAADMTVRVSVTPANNAVPTVVGAITDFSVEAGQLGLVFDLSQVFADPDVAAGTDSLAYSVTNSNPALLSATLSGSVLNVSFLSGQLGTANITARTSPPRSPTATVRRPQRASPSRSSPSIARPRGRPSRPWSSTKTRPMWCSVCAISSATPKIWTKILPWTWHWRPVPPRIQSPSAWTRTPAH
jgi:hypothetical protein